MSGIWPLSLWIFVHCHLLRRSLDFFTNYNVITGDEISDCSWWLRLNLKCTARSWLWACVALLPININVCLDTCAWASQICNIGHCCTGPCHGTYRGLHVDFQDTLRSKQAGLRCIVFHGSIVFVLCPLVLQSKFSCVWNLIGTTQPSKMDAATEFVISSSHSSSEQSSIIKMMQNTNLGCSHWAWLLHPKTEPWFAFRLASRGLPPRKQTSYWLQVWSQPREMGKCNWMVAALAMAKKNKN